MNRAEVFHYVGLDVESDRLRGHYELDGRHIAEEVVFDEVGDLRRPAVTAVAQLWYVVAGLSYYKAGAARRVDLGDTATGERGRELLAAALIDGLGEFSYRNQLPLDDVTIDGGRRVEGFALAVSTRW